MILAGDVFGPIRLRFGLMYSAASDASLLLNLEGVATMTIAWIVFKENVDRRLLLGAFAILAGAALLSWRGTADFQWSSILIAGACLCWGIDNNLMRKLLHADPIQIAMFRGLIAGAVNLVLSLVHGAQLPLVHAILKTGIVGFLATGSVSPASRLASGIWARPAPAPTFRWHPSSECSWPLCCWVNRRP